MMIDIIFGDANTSAPLVSSRLREFMGDLDPELFSDAQRRIFGLARQRLLAVVGRAVGSFGDWQKSLRSMADDLAELSADAAEVVARSLPEVSEEDVAALLAGEVPK